MHADERNGDLPVFQILTALKFFIQPRVPMKSLIRKASCFYVLAFGLAVATPAASVDINSNLSPLEIQDADPSDVGSRSVDVSARYQRTEDGENEWQLQPRVKFGVAKNMQLDIGTSIVGGHTREGSGDINARLLYRFVEQRSDNLLPSVAVSLRVDFLSGVDSPGLDTDARFIMSRKIASHGHGHMNLTWQHDAGARPGNREHRYGLIFGYDYDLSERTSLLSDLVLRQSQSPGKAERMVEIGLRHAPLKDLVLGAGLGWGINEDAPRYRVLFSAQKAF